MAFQIQMQTQPLWCWAAVAVSVDHYFSANSPWTQCNLGSVVLKKPLNSPNCCANPSVCNIAWFLHDALTVVKKLKAPPLGSPLAFADVKAQLDPPAYLPVCVRIGWYNGGGHFVVICGVGRSASGQPLVYVADPWYSYSLLTYDDFLKRYQNGKGGWTGTFLVHP